MKMVRRQQDRGFMPAESMLFGSLAPRRSVGNAVMRTGLVLKSGTLRRCRLAK